MGEYYTVKQLLELLNSGYKIHSIDELARYTMFTLENLETGYEMLLPVDEDCTDIVRKIKLDRVSENL